MHHIHPVFQVPLYILRVQIRNLMFLVLKNQSKGKERGEMEKGKLSGELKLGVKFIVNQKQERILACHVLNDTVQMCMSFVSQLCWQHNHHFTERNNCHRATEGLISQAGLLVCNQKADSWECFCTDPAGNPQRIFQVLLSILSSKLRR